MDPRLPPAHDVYPVLGIDCSGDLCSVAVALSADRVEERSVQRPGEQLRLLFPMAMSLLKELQMAPTELVRVAVAIGPASFTGIRLAITTARTVGQVLNIPLAPFSTLDIIGLGLLEWSPDARRVCVINDARKGQIFAACYDTGPGLSRVGEYAVLDPGAAVAWLDAKLVDGSVVGGSALRVYGDGLRGGVAEWARRVREAPTSNDAPRARHLAQAGAGRYGEVRLLAYDEVFPMYLRPPDVKVPDQMGTAGGRTSPTH